MHQSVAALPCRGLRAYVRAFAQRNIAALSPDVLQSVPACLESMLELDFANSPIIEYLNGTCEQGCPVSIVGPHTECRARMRLRGPVESFRVFFKPLALWQLFEVPIRLLVDRAYTAEAVLGREVLLLSQSMARHRSFPERVRLVEEYLLRRTAGLCPLTGTVSSALHILALDGAPSVATLATREGLGVRQFERRFLSEMGMCPKLFSRIARYQRALDSKVASPARSWLGIAHEFGYHDQMHMVRDFQSLGGASPSGTLLQLGDMRPIAREPAAGQRYRN